MHMFLWTQILFSAPLFDEKPPSRMTCEKSSNSPIPCCLLRKKFTAVCLTVQFQTEKIRAKDLYVYITT